MDYSTLPLGEYGFPGHMRDALVAAIMDGSKISTSSLVAQYDGALPQVGDLELVVDSAKKPVCVTENTAVTVLPLADVPLDHALNEGEGFNSVEQWRAAHCEFWNAIGFETNDDTPVVCVEFKVIPL